MNNSKINTKTLNLTETALMAALLCILGPVSIPIGPIPISLQLMLVFLAVYVLGTKRGMAAYLIYFLLGVVGLPVFSGFSGGLQKLVGPTGGFLAGFFPMALVAGLIVDRWWKNPVISAVGMYLGNILLYATGTLWYAFSAGVTVKAALMTTVVPFLLVDLSKIVVVALVGPVLRRRLIRSGLFLGNDGSMGDAQAGTAEPASN